MQRFQNVIRLFFLNKIYIFPFPVLEKMAIEGDSTTTPQSHPLGGWHRFPSPSFQCLYFEVSILQLSQYNDNGINNMPKHWQTSYGHFVT